MAFMTRERLDELWKQARQNLQVLEHLQSEAEAMRRDTCLMCRHFNLEVGCPDYSDMTPGESTVVECRKNKWDLRSGDTQGELRQCMLIGLTCPDFVRYDSEEATPTDGADAKPPEPSV